MLWWVIVVGEVVVVDGGAIGAKIDWAEI